MIYNRKSHCKYLIKIHLIIVTKYRHKIILGDLKDDIFKNIEKVSNDMGFKIDTMESDIDHIHILIDMPPQISVQQIVHRIKQVSTFYAYKKHRQLLKKYYWKEKFGLLSDILFDVLLIENECFLKGINYRI